MKNNKLQNITAKTIILAMIVFSIFTLPVFAEETSTNLTEGAQLETNNGMRPDAVRDDNYISYWYTNKAEGKYLEISSTEPIKYLYVAYAFKPSEIVIQTSQDGSEWSDFAYEYADEYYHVTYTFDTSCYYIRVKGAEGSKDKFGIVEAKIFSAGTLPDYIQQWQPTHEQADMLIFAAHPDDEAVFFSGIIPYYAGELNKKVTTVYMTASDPTRRSEALNYQWTMHEKNLPMFAYFEDVSGDSYTYVRSRWGDEKTLNYMVSVIRQLQPKVIVSHDIYNGEYGHGAHIYTAKSILKAVELANDPTYHEESYQMYGTHEIGKLYLHLYDESPIRMDVFDEPLDEYDGLTAIEAAQIGILEYASQLKWTVVRVHDETSPTSCYLYGLAYTTVGDDSESKDMFENIEPDPTPTPVPTETPKPTEEPTKQPTAAPSIEPTEQPVEENTGLDLGKVPTIVIIVIASILFFACVVLIVRIAKKLSNKQ